MIDAPANPTAAGKPALKVNRPVRDRERVRANWNGNSPGLGAAPCGWVGADSAVDSQRRPRARARGRLLEGAEGAGAVAGLGVGR
jgi:hypothetical protein